MIEKYRAEIDDIDRKIFSLIKRREVLSGMIGREKREGNIPDRDFRREKEVFDRAISLAQELDLPPNFVTKLQQQIIEFSLSRQEKDRIKNNFEAAPKSVLIVGGSGRLGTWLCQFFADSGHKVSVVDKVRPTFPCDFFETLDEPLEGHDIIVIATPIRVSVEILETLAQRKIKKPVIFDVSSVKAPVQKALEKLRSQGAKVTSLHPMFGPSVGLLFGKHIIQTSLGDKNADEVAKELFRSTSVTMVDMSIDEHDRIIANLLSLSHLLNIIFIGALKHSDISACELARFASPTFSDQLAIAARVFSENPNLYFEIQALNPNNQKIFQRLDDALSLSRDAILNSHEEAFINMMADGKNYLGVP